MVYKKKTPVKSKLVEVTEQNETKSLEDFLLDKRTYNLKKVLKQNENVFVDEDLKKNFSIFIRDKVKEKGYTQEEVAFKAGLSRSYGRKVFAGDTHPNKKDTILRICITADLTLKETNRALRFNKLPPLYIKYKRDYVIMVAINEGKKSVEDVNNILLENNLSPLEPCSHLK